jgi:hypothetical protein
MCFAIVEILLLLAGIYSLLSGHFKITNNLALNGKDARIAGLILIIPLPLVIGISMIVGALIRANVLPSMAEGYFQYGEISVVILDLILVIVFANYRKNN